MDRSVPIHHEKANVVLVESGWQRPLWIKPITLSTQRRTANTIIQYGYSVWYLLQREWVEHQREGQEWATMQKNKWNRAVGRGKLEWEGEQWKRCGQSRQTWISTEGKIDYNECRTRMSEQTLFPGQERMTAEWLNSAQTRQHVGLLALLGGEICCHVLLTVLE